MIRPSRRQTTLRSTPVIQHFPIHGVLEPRILLAGRTAVYLVSGLGGAEFPDGVSNYLNQLDATVNDPQKLRVQYSNWNSFDRASNTSPGAFDPVNFEVDTAGSPNNDIRFRNDLATDIANQGYDDQDVIVLIGHSLGGAAVLHAAERNIDINIDLLVLFDPVSSDLRGSRAALLGDEVPNNVTYFYNRWQNNTPFPVDYPIPGFFSADRSTGDLERDFGFVSQDPANTLRQSDNSVRRVPVDAVDTLFGLARLDPGDLGEFPFGVNGMGRPPRLPFAYSDSTHHDNLPLDNRLNFEVQMILEGLIPQPPNAVASIVPIGRPFREGDLITLSSAGSFDPNPGDTISYRWSQTAGPTVTLSDPTSPNPTFVATDDTFLDDSPIRFRLTVTDNTDASDSAVVELEVLNVPPSLSPVVGPDTFVRAFVVPLGVPYTDPGTADELAASWNFGDGTVTPFRTLAGTTGIAASPAHSYRDAGTYTVDVRVRDDDATSSVSKSVTIEIAGIIVDPDDPTKTALAVGGSTGDDTITLEPTNIPGQVRVTVVNATEGTFQRVFDLDPSSRVLVAGGEGRDSIEVRGDLGRRVDIDGGLDEDTIRVTGAGTDSGTSTPSGSAFGAGTITLNASPVNFLGVEAAIVSLMGDFRLITPNSADLVTIGPDPIAASRNRILISSGAILATPLSFFSVGSFVLDTGANDGAAGDDSVVLDRTGLIAAGLQDFTVNTGAGADTFTIASGLALPVAGGRFVFNAGGPTGPDGDRLFLTGNGSNIGIYSPDATTARVGSISEDGSSLDFTDLEDALVTSMADFRVVTPNTGDRLRIEATPFAEDRVSGSVGLVEITRLTFSAIADVTIDAASRQTDSTIGDDVTIDSPGAAALVAAGLRNFTIATGPGNDTLTINAADFRLPVAGGEFLFDSGSGQFADGTSASNLRGLISLDQMVVNADLDYLLLDGGTTLADGSLIPDQTTSDARLAIAPAGSGGATGAALGSVRMVGVEGATLTGGAGNNRMDASGFSGNVELNGLGGDDNLIAGAGDNVLDGGDGDDTLETGDDRFASPGLGSQARVLLGGGGRNLLQGGAGRDTFLAALAGTATLIGGADDDTFIVSNAAGVVTAPVGGIIIDGGGQAGDTLRLVGGGGATYRQTYLVGPSAGEGQIVTTNNYNPTGPTISQFLLFTGLAVIDDSIAGDQLTVVGASATAPIAGPSAADLAAGQIRLTVGGTPFAAIRFANKTNAAVQLADGQVVTTAAPVVVGPIALLSATLATPAPTPATGPSPIAAAWNAALSTTTSFATPAGQTTSPQPVGPIANRLLGPKARRLAAARKAASRPQLARKGLAKAKSPVAIPHPKGPARHQAAAKLARLAAHRPLQTARP